MHIYKAQDGAYVVTARTSTSPDPIARCYRNVTKRVALDRFKRETRTVFINVRLKSGDRETIDEMRRVEYANEEAFKSDLNFLLNLYRSKGRNVYTSSRPCVALKVKHHAA